MPCLRSPSRKCASCRQSNILNLEPLRSCAGSGVPLSLELLPFTSCLRIQLWRPAGQLQPFDRPFLREVVESDSRHDSETASGVSVCGSGHAFAAVLSHHAGPRRFSFYEASHRIQNRRAAPVGNSPLTVVPYRRQHNTPLSPLSFLQ